jgi:hypothetical protein
VAEERPPISLKAAGEMVRLRHGRVQGVSLADVASEPRLVDVDGERVRVAGVLGMELGD